MLLCRTAACGDIKSDVDDTNVRKGLSWKSLEMLLNKIEGIQVNQSIFGRLLGFGSITVTGTGGTKDPFHNIAAPFEFRKKAQEQIASVQNLENR